MTKENNETKINTSEQPYVRPAQQGVRQRVHDGVGT